MITYNASDIIKRATQLADIENSDFISFSEKIALLNEAYQTIYQKGINKGNNSFVRYINTTNKVIQLPPDFYQLKAVTLSHNKDVKVIMRRPANESFNILSYDIINNTLQINGETMGGTICVEYFPTPVTLTFPNVDKQLELENVLDMHKDIYLYKYNTDNDVIIRSLSDPEFADTLPNFGDSIHVDWNNEYIGETTLDEETFKDITVWKTKSGTIATSGYYLSIDEKPNGTFIVQLLNLTFNAGIYSGNIIFDALYKLPSDFNFQDSVTYYIKNGNNFEELKVNQSSHTFTTDPTTDNNFYIYQKGTGGSYNGIADGIIHMEDDYITFSNGVRQLLYNVNTGEITTTNNKVVIWKNMTLMLDGNELKLPSGLGIGETIDISLDSSNIAVLSLDKKHYVGQNYNSGLYIDGAHQEFAATKMFYYNDLVYLSNGTNYLSVYDFTNATSKNTLMDRSVISIADIDDNTGYGYLGLKMKKYALVSFYDDTQLNFPNNTYFVFMSYLLALAFKSKQGSDISQLAGLTEQAENTFYDTLTVDDWNSVRITNVY